MRISHGRSTKLVHANRREQLSYLLFRGMLFEATDPRDKLYALIGIASNVDDALKKKVVNYNQTESEVFTSMTALAIDSDNSYTVLSYAKNRLDDFRTQAQSKPPRWAVDRALKLKPPPSWSIDWAAKASQPTILQGLPQETLEAAHQRESLVKEFHT